MREQFKSVEQFLEQSAWFEYETEKAIKRNDHKAIEYWGRKYHALMQGKPVLFG